jgi:hypothetical protein
MNDDHQSNKSYDLRTHDLFKQLEAINEYETITWDINRYISDKAMEAKHG